MIDSVTKQKIIEAARIEEVVGDFVTLKRRGSNLIGLCPFHNEKTPSFIVSPAKGIFKCFGCAKGGDAITFVMEHEKCSYVEALKYLAEKYHIPFEEKPLSSEQIQTNSDRESMLQMVDFASRKFVQNLWESDEGRSVGLSYFRSRGFTDATIEKFQLGYSLEAWDDLSQNILKSGYNKKYLLDTGLGIEKEGKLYDRFRGRVIFPIYSVSNKIIGFGGRILSAEKSKAKYVNSPESLIYNKSQTLYGIAQSKSSIVSKDMAYLVEGYTDVISLYQAGITNVVASSGTSLTKEQIKMIHRFTKNISVLYDGDSAGIKASFRGINMLLEEGMHVRVVLFPDGDDPDSFVRKHTLEEVENYLKNNTHDFIRFKTQVLLEDVGDDPIKKAGLVEDILESIALVPYDLHRMTYIQECSRLMGMEEQSLMRSLNKIRTSLYLKEKKMGDKAGAEVANAVIQEYEPQMKLVEEARIRDREEKAKELEEYSLIKLLVMYGCRNTTQTYVDEEDRLMEEVSSVAAYLIQEISDDELKFDNPVYQKIFDLYKEQLESGKILSMEELKYTEDESIRRAVFEINDLDRELSAKWEEKGIYVRTDKDASVLNKMTRDTVISFKLSKVKQLLQNLNEKMKLVEGEELWELIKQKDSLDKVKLALARELGRVFV